MNDYRKLDYKPIRDWEPRPPREPHDTILVILAMALSLGANFAVFSIIYYSLTGRLPL